jgi:hypothetical protein
MVLERSRLFDFRTKGAKRGLQTFMGTYRDFNQSEPPSCDPRVSRALSKNPVEGKNKQPENNSPGKKHKKPA